MCSDFGVVTCVPRECTVYAVAYRTVPDRPDGREPTATRRGRLNGKHDIRYHVGVYLPCTIPPGAEMTSLRDGCTSLYLTLSRRGCKCNVATRGCDV